jgi:hypothetical protein
MWPMMQDLLTRNEAILPERVSTNICTRGEIQVCWLDRLEKATRRNASTQPCVPATRYASDTRPDPPRWCCPVDARASARGETLAGFGGGAICGSPSELKWVRQKGWGCRCRRRGARLEWVRRHTGCAEPPTPMPPTNQPTNQPTTDSSQPAGARSRVLQTAQPASNRKQLSMPTTPTPPRLKGARARERGPKTHRRTWWGARLEWVRQKGRGCRCRRRGARLEWVRHTGRSCFDLVSRGRPPGGRPPCRRPPAGAPHGALQRRSAPRTCAACARAASSGAACACVRAPGVSLRLTKRERESARIIATTHNRVRCLSITLTCTPCACAWGSRLVEAGSSDRRGRSRRSRAASRSRRRSRVVAAQPAVVAAVATQAA